MKSELTKEYFDECFHSLEKRFDFIDKRFGAVEDRLDAMDRRFEAIEKRLDAVETRLDAVEKHFEIVDERFQTLENKLERRIQESEANIIAYIDGSQAQQTQELKEHMSQVAREITDAVSDVILEKELKELKTRLTRLETKELGKT